MRVQSVYHAGTLEPTYPIQMYVVTFGIGCLVFQVFSAKHFGSVALTPSPGFELWLYPFGQSFPGGFVLAQFRQSV